MALFKDAGDIEGVAVMAHRLGIALLGRGELDRARKEFEDALRLAEQLGSRQGIAEGIGAFGYLAVDEGDPERAIPLFEESAAIAEEVGFTWWRAGMLAALAEAQLTLGRAEEGEASARSALTVAGAIEDRQRMVFDVALFAWASALSGDAARAGRFWGAVEAEAERAPLGQWEAEHELYAQRILVMEGPEFSRAREEGRRLTFARAVEEALAG